jgi:hypothetical protein
MTSITNGYDPEQFESMRDSPRSNSAIEIVHTGTIYADRSPGAFLMAMQFLDDSKLAGKMLRVRLIGDFMDVEKKRDIDDFTQRGLNASVMVESQVPHSGAIAAMLQADLLLLLDTPGRRAGVPAKLYEYIGARRPILALAELDSDVAWVLRESGVVHRLAPPRDSAAIQRALTELLQVAADNHGGDRPQPVRRRFIRQELAGELAALLDSCLERSPLRNRARLPQEVAL